MAQPTKNIPTEVTPEVVEYADIDALGAAQTFYERNKKAISTAVTVVLVAVVGYFGYTNLIQAPKAEKAATAMYWPQLYFQADSLNLALNGDGKNKGFAKLATEYKGTAAGNIARYFEGVCYLRMGDYAKAITALESFDGKGTMLGHNAEGLTGIAYLESGKADKAVEYFKKATADKDDQLVTPTYLYHLGMAYDASGKTAEAKETFKRLRDEYPRSQYAREMDKELARLGELN